MNLSQQIGEETSKLLEQSTAKIDHCVAQLTDDQVWFRPGGQLNSVGNLLLHLEGNLRQWSVVGIAGQPDRRQREAEFAADARQPVADVLSRLHETVAAAQRLFRSLDDQQWLESRTIQGFTTTVLAAVMHTTSHFVGHTHQIVYVTRLQLGEQYVLHWSPAEERRDIPI